MEYLFKPELSRSKDIFKFEKKESNLLRISRSKLFGLDVKSEIGRWLST